MKADRNECVKAEQCMLVRARGTLEEPTQEQAPEHSMNCGFCLVWLDGDVLPKERSSCTLSKVKVRWLVFPATMVPTDTSFRASLQTTTFGVFLFFSSSLVGRHRKSTWMFTPRLESWRDMAPGPEFPVV